MMAVLWEIQHNMTLLTNKVVASYCTSFSSQSAALFSTWTLTWGQIKSSCYSACTSPMNAVKSIRSKLDSTGSRRTWRHDPHQSHSKHLHARKSRFTHGHAYVDKVRQTLEYTQWVSQSLSVDVAGKSHSMVLISLLHPAHTPLLLIRALCRQKCSLLKPKPQSKPLAFQLDCKLVSVQHLAKSDDTKEKPSAEYENAAL